MMILILTSGTSTGASLNIKMAPPKLRHGVGATCSVLLTRLHPANVVSEKYTNLEHGRRLSDLICIRQEDKIVSRRLQSCFVYQHGDFEGKELHAVGRWSKVEVEGNCIHYFGSNDTNQAEEKEEGASEEVVQIQIPTEVSHAKRKRQMKKHTLATAPTHATKFLGGKWIRKAKSAYQQHICRGQKCKKQVRSHCACTPGHWLCGDCFQNHILDEYSSI
jgi:hypothetical protein